jgi:hypothetical protein
MSLIQKKSRKYKYVPHANKSRKNKYVPHKNKSRKNKYVPHTNKSRKNKYVPHKQSHINQYVLRTNKCPPQQRSRGGWRPTVWEPLS